MVKKENISLRFYNGSDKRYFIKNYKKLLLPKYYIMDDIEKRIYCSMVKEQVRLYSFKDNEEKISFCVYTLKYRLTVNSNFLSSTIESYISYNKKTKKLFFKSDTNNNNILYQILKNANEKNVTLFKGHYLEWIFQNSEKIMSFIGFISKNTLKKILSNKITNFNDLLKSVNKDKKIIFNNNSLDVCTHFNYSFYLKMSSNQERDIEAIKTIIKNNTNYDHIFNDFLKLSYELKRKVNFTWSLKRIKNEHDKLVKIVNNIKSKYIDEKNINYLNEIPPHDNFKLLKTNKEFYYEGNELGHCLFTNNYFYSAEQGICFYLAFKDNECRGTAEISKRNEELYIKQFYSYGNNAIPNEKHIILKNYISDENVLNWFNKESENLKNKNKNLMNNNNQWLI